MVQAAFPLAVAFTPVMARAGEQHLLLQPAPLSSQRTQVYTLGVGETAVSVAKKFNLTLDKLRELNQFRTFAHGLNGLQAGDEVDVPLLTTKNNKILSKTATASYSDGASSTAGEGDEQAQKVAGYTSQVGRFLAGGTNGDAAASMARGMATGEAGGALQQWLSRFGTARVQLDADKNFSLKNSQFDLLVPLHDHGGDLVFTQGSLHRTDSRTQANLGAGLRHFTPTSMLGGNLFGDYDLSRNHARAGAGLEYWRDFLKLSANGYMRLTGWKDSPDLADYQERPANGWDIRAQAWLPSLPQLGGKLTYEQYYGKEVALFGVDNRQKNPQAITAGVNYTPVPLITLGAERRQGQSSKSDTRVTMDLNYQLGVPWRNQMDPTTVAAMRSLAGNRYALVERNNNIVLEYRKKEFIRLHTADLITGKAREQKSLGVSVTSTYGLSHIDWEASTLSAAGGKIVQNGTDYALVLPAFQTAAQATNTYTVSGVAVDTKGNRSERSDTQVTVQAPEVNKQYSTLTPVSSVLPTDGKSSQVLTLTLRNENNQPVDINVKDISLKTSALKSATVSAITKKSAGVYTFTVKAGKDIENVTLTPTVSGITLSSATVTINSTTPDPGQSVFTASPDIIVADNTTTTTLTLVVKDAQSNVLTGLKDSLSFVVKDSGGKARASGVITVSAITESSTKGTYTATLKGTTAGKYTVVPQFNGMALGSLNATVTLTATTPVQTKSAIAVNSTTYVAGSDMTVKVTLKDGQDNPVTGATPSLTADAVTVANATLKSSGWADNGDGTYSATYTAVKAGTSLKAMLKLSDWNTAGESAAYAITATTPVQAKSAIAVNSTTYVAGSDMTVKVTLKDGQDNPVTGATPSLTADAVTVANATLKSSGWADNGDGTYSATYTAVKAGTGFKAVLKLGGWGSGVESGAYAITADSSTAQIANLRVTADKALADGKATNGVQAIVADAHGNLVMGQAVTFTANNGATVTTVIGTTGVDGIATAKLTSTAAGTSTVTATVNGSSQTVNVTFVVVVGTANVSGSQKVNFFPRTFSTAFEPDKGYTFDKNCLKISGKVAPKNYGTTPVSQWGNTELNYNTVGNYEWSLTITNSCGRPVSGKVVTQLFRSDGRADKQYSHVTVFSQGHL